MNTILFPSDSRGHANHGWLNTYHSFSFANYFHPDRINFGALRVLNDDSIAGGKGFGSHPHSNMEIITIPLSGSIQHQDSMGHTEVIKPGEVQVMSAGKGIVHSEFNADNVNELKLFQIWILPNEKDVVPRYDQKSFNFSVKNEWISIVSPKNFKDANLWIHQEAWLHLGYFDKDFNVEYYLNKSDNGIYLMVIEGSFSVNGQNLNARDAIGIWEAGFVTIQATSKNSRILLIEVPMISIN
ncbi:pirin family protein [Apibacter muscae]|uniref:pirin family protein n=1 Tax=Apibacter muscae TaxID=2509004 RepID=UPI0011AD0E99|nr:pirin family protein [Apibacter muscae]TWP30013.1 pirin family protein [Apibacter muscae]